MFPCRFDGLLPIKSPSHWGSCTMGTSSAMDAAVKHQLLTVTILFYWCPNSPGKSANDFLILPSVHSLPHACNIWIFFLATTRLYYIHTFIFISEAFEQNHRQVKGIVKHKERQVPAWSKDGLTWRWHLLSEKACLSTLLHGTRALVICSSWLTMGQDAIRRQWNKCTWLENYLPINNLAGGSNVQIALLPVPEETGQGLNSVK